MQGRHFEAFSHSVVIVIMALKDGSLAINRSFDGKSLAQDTRDYRIMSTETDGCSFFQSDQVTFLLSAAIKRKMSPIAQVTKVTPFQKHKKINILLK